MLPLQTPEQVAAEQKMNGTVPVVGTVPIKTNPDGTGPELKSDTKAANLLSTIRPPGDSQLAAKNVSLASQTLELEGRHGPSAFFLGFVALGILAALLFAGKTYLEKFGPSPDRLKSL